MEDEDSLLLPVTSDSAAPAPLHTGLSFDLTDSPLHPSEILVEPTALLRLEDRMTYRTTSRQSHQYIATHQREKQIIANFFFTMSQKSFVFQFATVSPCNQSPEHC